MTPQTNQLTSSREGGEENPMRFGSSSVIASMADSTTTSSGPIALAMTLGSDCPAREFKLYSSAISQSSRFLTRFGSGLDAGSVSCSRSLA